MKRLTEHVLNGEKQYIRILGCSSLYVSKERKGAHLHNAVVRLAQYEDTGLTPNEIIELKRRLCEQPQ